MVRFSAFKKLIKNQFPPPGKYETVEFSPDLQDIKDSLKTGPKIGEGAWAAIFEIYQAELQLAVGDIKGTRENLQWVDENNKAVGCGETWPLENRGQDNYRSQTNRRVEILFYDPEELLVKDLPCKDGKCAEADCHIFKNIDRYDDESDTLTPNLEWNYIHLEPDGQILGSYKLVTDLLMENEPKVVFHLSSNREYHLSISALNGEVDAYGYLSVVFHGIPAFDRLDLAVEDEDGVFHSVFCNVPYLSLSDMSDQNSDQQIEPNPSEA